MVTNGTRYRYKGPRNRYIGFLWFLGFFAVVYFAAAYLFLPQMWRHYERHHGLEHFEKTSTTAEGIPGDPLNVGLVAGEAELVAAFQKAGWSKADLLKISTDIGMVKSVLMHNAYPQAPMSKLYLFGRPQDLGFEKEVSGSAKQRHHVRFWDSGTLSGHGRSLWVGSATFDKSVGFSHTTGEVTHHIAPDIDGERNAMMRDLIQAKQIENLYQVTGVGPTMTGRNGAYDWYYTDGELTVGVISKNNVLVKEAPAMAVNPLPTKVKNTAWSWLRYILKKQKIEDIMNQPRQPIQEDESEKK